MTAPASSAATPIFHPNLPLSMIVESVHNPRKRFDETSLRELADTIAARGIHNPVLVREIDTPAGFRFELAAGHRRCRAARLVGLVEVPALIMQLDDNAFVELLHLDNLQRDDIDPLDEALGYEQLLERGYDLSTLAEKIRKSITYVASRVRLLSLGAAAREAMRLGYVKVSHAIELAKLPEGVQEQLLEEKWNLSPKALLKSAGVFPEGDDQADAHDNAADNDEDDDEEGEEYFPAPAPDARFRAYQWDAIQEPTLQDLKRALALDVYRKLSVVPWDRADAALVPEAGACTQCPKRSSMEPVLFAELDTGEDACLDASCYDAKRERYYDLQRGIRRESEAATTEDTESEARRFQREVAKRTNDEQRKAHEQQIRARQIAQVGRTAAVRAVVRAVPKDAMRQVPWLQLILVALLGRLGTNALDQLLMLMKLDRSVPDKQQEWDQRWRVERITGWVQAPERRASHLVRAIALATIGRELAVVGTDADKECDVLLQLGALSGVDVHAVSHAAQETAKTETKKARRKTKAKAVST